MSNYPPGVTGNEPAIAGYPEGTHDAGPCSGYMPDDSRAVPVWMISEIGKIQEAIGRGETNTQVQLERLRLGMLDLPKAVDVECLFEGKVDAYFVGDRRGNGEVVWECPRCGHENRDEVEEPERDHPDL